MSILAAQDEKVHLNGLMIYFWYKFPVKIRDAQYNVAKILYPTRPTIYVLIFVFIIAPVESASPDLSNLLLQNLIISTDFLLSKY